MTYKRPEIDERFAAHPVDEKTADAMAAMHSDVKMVANAMEDVLVDSREKALALTKIEEALMWADKCFTRYGQGLV